VIVVIYNENCIQWGREVSFRDLEQYEDPRECGDWTVYEGTPEELIKLADTLPSCRSRRYDIYYCRVKESIRNAVLFESPELEPREG